jgi:hypothetical protein
MFLAENGVKLFISDPSKLCEILLRFEVNLMVYHKEYFIIFCAVICDFRVGELLA